MESFEQLPPRTVSESVSEMAEVVLPNDANPLNNLLGGRLMHFIDIAGAMAAHRHSRSSGTTSSGTPSATNTRLNCGAAQQS